MRISPAIALSACVASCTAQNFNVPPQPDSGPRADSSAPAGDAGDLIAAGEVIYRDPFSPMSKLGCANCHAIEEPAEDGFRRPGHEIGDATKRPSYKNGLYTSFLDAVNSCLVEWMKTTPWTETDPSYLALRAFLDSKAPAGAAPVIDFQIVEPPADVSGGNASHGQDLFNGSCARCHGRDGVGTDYAIAIRGLADDEAYIARKVRKSGPSRSATYDGHNLGGGQMPFWAADRLSDAELIDIVAFVFALQGSMPPPDASMGGGTDAGAGD